MLTEIYCYNVKGEDNGAHHYTTNLGVRWDHCDSPSINQENRIGHCEMSDFKACGCDKVQ